MDSGRKTCSPSPAPEERKEAHSFEVAKDGGHTAGFTSFFWGVEEQSRVRHEQARTHDQPGVSDSYPRF